MTRSIPWLRVFIEGVVIVGSILLAFGTESNSDSPDFRTPAYLEAMEDQVGGPLDGARHLSRVLVASHS